MKAELGLNSGGGARYLTAAQRKMVRHASIADRFGSTVRYERAYPLVQPHFDLAPEKFGAGLAHETLLLNVFNVLPEQRLSVPFRRPSSP